MTYYANIACDLPRDTKMLMAGWQGRAVYVEGVLFARENLTDGVLERVALPLWMPDMNVKTRAKHLDRLAELGALETLDNGWRFPTHVWSRWNPSRSEVESKREAERQRKAEYRERRRREREVSDECPNVVPLGRMGPGTSRGAQTETETETETEISSSYQGHQAPVDKSGIDEVTKRLSERFRA
jgi:hypothetical protein